MLHPARYLQAFHSAPHMRPPMCHQYAVWAVAANEHPKYHSYHDVFYRRARQYLEADELRVGRVSAPASIFVSRILTGQCI